MLLWFPQGEQVRGEIDVLVIFQPETQMARQKQFPDMYPVPLPHKPLTDAYIDICMN